MIGFKSLKGLNELTVDDEGFVHGAFLQAGGGKGGGSAPAPIFVPPPAAPAVTEASTQASAATPEEELERKKKSIKSGAKSLQIPLTDSSSGRTIGTGTSSTK